MEVSLEGVFLPGHYALLPGSGGFHFLWETAAALHLKRHQRPDPAWHHRRSAHHRRGRNFEIVDATVRIVDSRVPVLVGVSSNSTMYPNLDRLLSAWKRAQLVPRMPVAAPSPGTAIHADSLVRGGQNERGAFHPRRRCRHDRRSGSVDQHLAGGAGGHVPCSILDSEPDVVEAVRVGGDGSNGAGAPGVRDRVPKGDGRLPGPRIDPRQSIRRGR